MVVCVSAAWMDRTHGKKHYERKKNQHVHTYFTRTTHSYMYDDALRVARFVMPSDTNDMCLCVCCVMFAPPETCSSTCASFFDEKLYTMSASTIHIFPWLRLRVCVCLFVSVRGCRYKVCWYKYDDQQHTYGPRTYRALLSDAVRQRLCVPSSSALEHCIRELTIAHSILFSTPASV